MRKLKIKKNLKDINIKNLFYLGEIPDPDILVEQEVLKD